MKTTRKNILYSILFLAGLVVILLVASWLFQPKQNRESYGMEDWRANGILGEPKQTIDVLFIGDSISYCSINPLQIWRDYGITSYVCATSEQKLYYSKEFLSKTFEKQSPQVVFLGASTIFTYFSYKDEVKNISEQILPVLRYHDRWKKAGTYPELDSGMLIEYSHQTNDKGYYFSTGKTEVDVTDYAKPTDAIEWIPDINKDAVAEIKEFCDDNNAKLILLSEPNASGAWAPHRHNAIAKLAEELQLEYIDLNYMQEEVPINWSEDSFDSGDHLNYYGAQKVSAYLGRFISDMNIFEDKRENAQYASWNEAQEIFYSELEGLGVISD